MWPMEEDFPIGRSQPIMWTSLALKQKKKKNRYYVLVGMVQQKGMFCNFFRFTKTVKIYLRKLFFDPTKAGYPPPCKQALS